MDSKSSKTDQYLGYLLCKRDEFMEKLVRVGSKLMNCDEKYDLETFIRTFVPTVDSVKEKIVKAAQKKVEEKESSDLDLLEALRAQFCEFERDFKELREISEAEECESDGKADDKKKIEENKQQSDTLNLPQIINPGEMAKIFVQKSRIDCIRSSTDKPDFDDDILETIYIYRSKRS
jgi:hypothetical protein